MPYYQDHAEERLRHQKYLKNRDHYYTDDKEMPWRKLAIAGISLAAGAAGVFAFKKSLFKKGASSAAKAADRFNKGSLRTVTRGLHDWTRTEESSFGLLNLIRSSHGDPVLLGSLAKQRAQQMTNSLWQSILNTRSHLVKGRKIQHIPYLEHSILQMENVLQKASWHWTEQGVQNISAGRTRLEQIMRRAIEEKFSTTAKGQAEMMKMFGMRHLLVRDLPVGHSTRSWATTYGQQGWLDLQVDPFMYINKAGDIIDIRPVVETVLRQVRGFERHFGLPLVNFNPLSLLYADDLLKLQEKPLIYHFAKGTRQPFATGNIDTYDNLVFIDGSVWDITNTAIKEVTEGRKGVLVGSKGFLAQQYMRGMAGVPAEYYVGKQPWSRPMEHISLGRQTMAPFKGEELIPSVPELVTNYLFEKLWKVIKPYKYRFTSDEPVFGAKEQWVYLNKTDVLDLHHHLAAGRQDLTNVSTATLVPYLFLSRLNTMLGHSGFGLGIENLGSTKDVAWGLFAKRFFPVIGGIVAWQYLNYESENITGLRPAEVMADTYRWSAETMAGIMDFTGLTDVTKQAEKLFPGFEQITDAPLIGAVLPYFGLTREEMEYEFEHGEEAVRKGRWWPLSNTPFTGSRIEFWRPNWYRRVHSQWQFTDVLHGSEEEYFANAPFPTPRYPAAPIRHFITDPYHYEKKHYYDRPYLVTGGISELEEFPLIGPILGGTIGNILKPQKRMHPEVWQWIDTGIVPQSEGAPPELVIDRYREVEKEKPYVTPGHLLLGVEDGVEPASLQTSPFPTWGTDYIGIGSAQYDLARHGKDDVVVAVLDSGFDVEHETLKDIFLPGYNVLTGTEDVSGHEEHGTHVAGIVSTANRRGEGDQDLPVVKILPIKVFRDVYAYDEDITKGIEYAINWRGPKGERVSVINMSLGSDVVNPHHVNIIKKAHDAGILVVAAAGNSGLEASGGPAIWPEALSVGALEVSEVDKEGVRLADYSNRNIGVDISAPGSDIVSTLPDDTYGAMSGTSMASSYTAMAAAMLKAIQPDLAPAELRYILKGSAVDLGKQGKDSLYASGGINIGFAASLLRDLNESERRKLRNAAAIEEFNIAAERIALVNHIRNKYGNELVKNINDAIVDQHRRKVIDPDAASARMMQFWENIREFAGFYGFVPEIVSEETWRHEPRIATSQTITSYRRQFWDSSIGGLGDSLNEIARRFIGKKEFYSEHYNPIPNRMPSWMPSSEYFLDFIRGDVYASVKSGEMRLPGGGYEALNEVPVAELFEKYPILQLAERLGAVNRLEYYDPFNRFKILANVAPWSEEYKHYSKMISGMKLTPEQKEEAKRIRKRAGMTKQPQRLYEYRFRYKETQKEMVTIEKVIDSNNFLTKEYPNHPVRLAGLYVPIGKNDKVAQETAKVLEKLIYPGAKVMIAYDPDKKVKNDTYGTIRATVYTSKGNLNLTLLKRGLATEKEDYSPAGIEARFTPMERRMGRAWEKFAHLDTPLHTKLLQVRSPAEDWWRREVYGKNFQKWENAGRDYLIPTYQSFMMRDPVTAAASGAVIGALFGRTRYGRFFGAAVGALTVGAGSLYRSVYEKVTGRRWIPERRRKEWEIEEHIDILKYIKHARLFAHEARAAMQEENFDIFAFFEYQKSEKKSRKKRIETLTEAKREIYRAKNKVNAEYMAEKYDVTLLPMEESEKLDPIKHLTRSINEEIKQLSAKQPEPVLPPRAAKAYEYYQKAKQTMYGYEVGEPLKNFLTALPKKERRYFNLLLEAPDEEWQKVRTVLPSWMLRVLGPMRGDYNVPEKPELEEYFESHFLPDAEWEGWHPATGLEDVKVNLVRREAMDVAEFNIWQDDIARANLSDTPVPKMFNPVERGNVLKNKLSNLLSGTGIEDIDIIMEPVSSGLRVQMDIQQDRTAEIANFLNNNALALVR
jgi:endonuclease YncB( thermonuclease family)